MNQRLIKICLFFCCCIAIPIVTLAGISFYIGSQNTKTSCDNDKDDFIRLSTWLFVNYAVSISSLLVYISVLLLFVWFEKYIFLIAFILIYIFNWLFVLIWSILGAIELFNNAQECKNEAPSLWIVTLITIIFQWVGMLHICWIRRCDCSSLVTDYEFKEHEGRNPLIV